MINNKIKFKRKISIKGTSPGFSIPKELLDFIGCSLGDMVILTGDTGKHGNFIVMFKDDETNSETITE